MKNDIKSIFPNTLTLLNLLSGTIGIVFSFKGNFIDASIMIFFGAVFDFFDGFVARALHVVNPIGKDLDSLSDLVTFGLLPSFIIFNYLAGTYIAYLSFLIVIFSALRLAKFNNDPEQKTGFKGLPTPALAVFFGSLVIWLEKGHIEAEFMKSLLIYLVIFMSIFLVLPLPMMALKFSGDYSWQTNWRKYVFVILAFVLIIVFKWIGLSAAVILYIFYSLVMNKF